MHRLITMAMIEAVINNEVPDSRETSMADKNCPPNIAMVQKLAFKPLRAGVLLLTTRLLKSGVDIPKPRPIKTIAIPRITGDDEIKYSRYAIE